MTLKPSAIDPPATAPLRARRPKLGGSNPTFRIFRFEWRNLLAERALWVAGALFAVLIAYAFGNGLQVLTSQQDRVEVLVAERESELGELKSRLESLQSNGEAIDEDAADFYSQGYWGYPAVLTPTPLAVLSVGQSDLQPNYSVVAIVSKQRQLSDKYGLENPLGLLVGRFDLAFLVIYLLPLAILALTYDLVSGERENGTLAMSLSQPVRLARLVAAKAVFRSAIPIAAVLALTLALLAASGLGAGWRQLAWGLPLWAVVVAAYGAFWAALSVFVNSLGRSSASNAVTLAAAWLALVLVIPQLLSISASMAYPMPARTELVSAIREEALDLRRDAKQLMAEFYGEHPELRPEGFDESQPDAGDVFMLIQADNVRRAAPIEQRYNAQLARQQGLVNRLRFLSPAVAAQEALNDIAGTDSARYQRFRTQTESFRLRWFEHFIPRVIDRRAFQAEAVDAIPRFRFEEEPIGDRSGRIGLGLLAAVLPASLLAGISRRRLSRYPVQG